MFSVKWVQLYYSWFKERQEDVNDDPRSDHPSTSATNEDIEAMKKMILDNRRITIRKIAVEVGTSSRSCQQIFTDVLGKNRAAVQIVVK